MSQPGYLSTIEDRHSETSPKDKAAKAAPDTSERDSEWSEERLIGDTESSKADAELVNVKNNVYDVVDDHTVEGVDYKPGVFYASDVGLCRRQLFLKKLGVANPNKRLRGKYLTGSLVHQVLQNDIRDKVVFQGRNDAEFDKFVSFEEDGIEFRGRADMVNNGTGRLVDFKTRSTWYGFNPPVFDDVDEAFTLMQGLESVDKVSFAYVNVKTFETRIYPKGVGAGKYIDFNEDRWQVIKKRVFDVQNALEDRLEGRGRSDLVVEGFDDIPFDGCGECELCSNEDKEEKAPDTHYSFDVTVGDVIQ